MRSRFAFLVASSCVVFACASDAGAAQRYLEKSNITLPQKAGRFEFDSAKFDPAAPEDGLIALYTWPGKPEKAAILVQVSNVPAHYETIEVAQVARQIENRMRGNAVYQDLQAGKVAAETVSRPPSFLTKGRTAAAQKSIGARQSYSYRINGEPVLATAMVFRHALYEYRLSLVSPAASVSPDAHEKLAIEAVHALVPAIDVRNFGWCGHTGLDPQSEAETRAEELEEIQHATQRAYDRNCSLSEAEQPVPPPKDGQHYSLVFPPR